MTETYGDVGCDGADEDMARVMSCWYVDRSSDAPTKTIHDWFSYGVSVLWVTVATALLMLSALWMLFPRLF